MSTLAVYPHLTVDDSGTIRIGRTRYKVAHLASEHYHYGWSAEELLRQHPDLRPEQVYASLTYFYDHFDEIVSGWKADEDMQPAIPAQPFSRDELLKRHDGAS